MVAYTDSLGFNRGSGAPPVQALNKMTLVAMTLDFAKIAAARVAAGVAALAVADTLQVIIIPAKTLVENVALDVVTLGSVAGGTIALGDSSAAAGYLAASGIGSGAALGIAGGIPTLTAGAFAPTLSGGKVYNAADYILATLGTALPTGAVVRVIAEMIDLS